MLLHQSCHHLAEFSIPFPKGRFARNVLPGKLHIRQGEFEAAEQSLRTAFLEAEAVGDDSHAATRREHGTTARPHAESALCWRACHAVPSVP